MDKAGEWCLDDAHSEYEAHMSFNAWLESGEDDALTVLDRIGLSTLSAPSKALFAGDRILYSQEIKRFQTVRRGRALGEGILLEPWVANNRARFDQVLQPLRVQNVVPFVGAGVSCASDFPGWGGHLLRQGIVAGFPEDEILAALSAGNFEEIIERIVLSRGPETFIQELRDEFLRLPTQVDLARRIVGLTPGLIVTTNYDRVLQTAVRMVDEADGEVLSGVDPSNQSLVVSILNRLRSILMIHGDISKPQLCILRKSQYDTFYGSPMTLTDPVPKKLKLLYLQKSILFLGCSLLYDRTLSVFERVHAESAAEELPQHFAIVEAPEDLGELPDRNSGLLKIGITPIFYPYRRHEFLSLIVDELLSEIRAN
jgi:hypothetical protein